MYIIYIIPYTVTTEVHQCTHQNTLYNVHNMFLFIQCRPLYLTRTHTSKPVDLCTGPHVYLLQFARWLSEAKLHGAWCGKTYNNTTIVIPTMLQHLWHKSSAPYCMHFDNHLANCNTPSLRSLHLTTHPALKQGTLTE